MVSCEFYLNFFSCLDIVSLYKISPLELIFGLNLKKKIIYLAASGLSCGMWDLSLQGVGA